MFIRAGTCEWEHPVLRTGLFGAARSGNALRCRSPLYMIPHNVRRKTKELLVIALVLNVAVVGGYIFLFIGVKEKNERISVLVNEIEAKVAEENTHSSIRAIVAQTVKQRNQLAKYSIAKEEAVSFIELLERTGREIGVSVNITSVRETEIPETPVFEHLTLALTATGTWPGVVRFLGRLESLPYEAKVTQAAVSKTDTYAGSWNISLSLSALKEK